MNPSAAFAYEVAVELADAEVMCRERLTHGRALDDHARHVRRCAVSEEQGVAQPYEHADRPITGSLNGVVLDPELRYGSVSIGTAGGFTLPAGKRVPFAFGVPSGVDLWIFYDPDADGPDPAEWKHVSSHEVFYAGDKRPFSFSLAYEGSEAAMEQTVIAKAAVNAYCPGSNSWRVLRAPAEVV